MPSYSIQFRRGTATDHSSFTGELAEITIDITNNRVVLHDGETPGGIPLAKVTDLPIDVGDLSDDLTHIAAATAPTGISAYGGDRQIAYLGYHPYQSTYLNNIEYFAFGDSSATDFGDANVTTSGAAAFSDGTRAVFAGGSSTNTIDYINIASPGQATTFGNHLNNTSAYMSGISDGTYGVYGAASTYYYVTIQTPGTASTFDTAAVSSHLGGSGGAGDGTYGIFAGADDEKIEKVTIATQGSATSHGDLSPNVVYPALMSDDTYTVFTKSSFNTDPYLQYITTATGGTAQDFANLYYGNQWTGASSDGTYGFTFGGSNSPTRIQYITFTSPSNQATSMGDLITQSNQNTGTSGASA